MFLFILCIFIIGLFFGSFFNVVIDRLPREENFFVGRSHCDFCGHSLSWYDLFPLFSFLFLRGKCRYCHRFIGWKYPLIELITGVSFAFVILQNPSLSFVDSIFLVGIVSCLVIIFFTDLFSGIIPDVILFPLAFFAVVRVAILHQSILPFLVASLSAGLFFLFLYFITRRKGIGFGDVKYAFVMGALLGSPGIIIGLYVAFLTGALIASILIVVRRKSFGNTIAFGPFLVMGTIISLFWQNPLWSILLHIIGY